MDREVGDLRGGAATAKQFTYLRYNAQLSQAGLAQIKLADIDPSHVQQLDSVAYMPELRRVGEALGQQVTETHFPKAFDC